MIIPEIFEKTIMDAKLVPPIWKTYPEDSECTIHQLSPYIGKLRASIAHYLVSKYSKKKDLIVDPFSGSGTIPLEAILQGRSVFASDISIYAQVISKAKLFHPQSLDSALSKANELLHLAHSLPAPDLRKVPQWVRTFFHPETLKEALNFRIACKAKNSEFYLACLLGILHHQRPGFLSYPSSHLTPYLRTKKFPKSEFPEMYDYRPLKPRLIAKIERSFKKMPDLGVVGSAIFSRSPLQSVKLPESFDCLITSPPYMNALDYGRDNRLRLWFIDPNYKSLIDEDKSQNKDGFRVVMNLLAKKIMSGLKKNGTCVFVVGDKVSRNYDAQPSKIVCDVMKLKAPGLELIEILKDEIPDLRRARKDYRGVKSEHFLVYKRK